MSVNQHFYCYCYYVTRLYINLKIIIALPKRHTILFEYLIGAHLHSIFKGKIAIFSSPSPIEMSLNGVEKRFRLFQGK